MLTGELRDTSKKRGMTILKLLGKNIMNQATSTPPGTCDGVLELNAHSWSDRETYGGYSPVLSNSAGSAAAAYI